MEDFVNRESQFPNRRRLEIVSQTPNEIIANIYRDEGNVDVEGTPITAKTLNDMKKEFANRGTTINVNGEAQSSINFTSDPQTQINTLNTNLSEQQSNKANIDASNLTSDNIDSWQNKLNTKLYLHTIKLEGWSATVQIITNNKDVFTYSTLAKYLYDNGFISSAVGYPCVGLRSTGSRWEARAVVWSTNGTTITSLSSTGGNTISENYSTSITFIDAVVSINVSDSDADMN